jgi:oligopeptide/dipeptide ABC transporter ATP-binding protein
MALLEVKDLKTYIYVSSGIVKAVDGVDFEVDKEMTLGIVGESGCGKTMTCLSILRLVPKPFGRIVGGQVLFKGEDLLNKSEREMHKYRGGSISMIFQDPMTSLNPVFTIGNQIVEAISIHQNLKPRNAKQRALDMLKLVRISSGETIYNYYPHQLSGGMRQRTVGAIALSCQPDLLIADECTTALDTTIQLQYLNLLKDIQRKTKVAMIFVTHDFGIVAKMCDQVAVMYAGKIVEAGNVRQIFNNAAHPYTIGLMKALPKLQKKVNRLYTIEGQPPSLQDLGDGCPFAPRCPYVQDQCCVTYPPKIQVESGHTANCWNIV